MDATKRLQRHSVYSVALHYHLSEQATRVFNDYKGKDEEKKGSLKTQALRRIHRGLMEIKPL